MIFQKEMSGLALFQLILSNGTATHKELGCSEEEMSGIIEELEGFGLVLGKDTQQEH